MKRLCATCLVLTALAACAAGPTPGSAKSNAFARATILSKNARSITIRHSTWGESTAFKWADDYCRTMGKSAIPSMSAQGYGPDVTSTWLCE